MGRLLLALACLVVETPGSRADESPAFPVPAALADAVGFWKRVWSEWDLGSVVLHDNRYPTVIYEVAALPGWNVFPVRTAWPTMGAHARQSR